jgi:hypothetical protein
MSKAGSGWSKKEGLDCQLVGVRSATHELCTEAFVKHHDLPAYVPGLKKR